MTHKHAAVQAPSLWASLFALAIAPAAALAGDNYRCVDEQGNVTYSSVARAGCEPIAAQVAPPLEPPAFMAHLPKHELKLDTLTGCGLIDSASIGPGASLFGMRIGRDSLEDVIGKLEKQGAKLNSGLGYRGYREDLPIVAIQDLPAARQFGALKEAWLRFNSLRVLYRVTLAWEGGSAAAPLRAMLAQDHAELAHAAACTNDRARCAGSRDGVALELNADDNVVTLSIASAPLDKEARNTEKLIDDDIRRKRVGSAKRD